jgi:hypothetical protein
VLFTALRLAIVYVEHFVAKCTACPLSVYERSFVRSNMRLIEGIAESIFQSLDVRNSKLNVAIEPSYVTGPLTKLALLPELRWRVVLEEETLARQSSELSRAWVFAYLNVFDHAVSDEPVIDNTWVFLRPIIVESLFRDV